MVLLSTFTGSRVKPTLLSDAMFLCYWPLQLVPQGFSLFVIGKAGQKGKSPGNEVVAKILLTI
jgi:hypothetical protein